MDSPLEIQVWPAPVLQQRAAAVADITGDLVDQAARMGELMIAREGIGLAAPQVGRGIRLFVVNLEREPGKERVFVNPEIVSARGKEKREEGCLSVPGLFAEVPRATELVLRAYDLDGNEFTVEARDFEARVLQHELDHLDGVLFLDRLSLMKKLGLRQELKRLKEQYDRSQQES